MVETACNICCTEYILKSRGPRIGSLSHIPRKIRVVDNLDWTSCDSVAANWPVTQPMRLCSCALAKPLNR